ncbi:CBO0543 family protein [Sporomusa termitida]|uniref:Uncharacterized protein n=1 Tax=Sporomusa termitida TaxID=2377 RepID=A0A517DVJ9_9FIRM|nr:CBO0543 family protein [Sporomusa termitida]QDR81296.1 hypothetical protein SPTER_26730 [Sporomusa termitida]
MDTFYQLVNAVIISANISYFHWSTKEVLSLGWLVVAGFLAIACVLLFILIDKSRLREILLFGFILTFLFVYTDVIATEYGLWEYKTRIIPIKASIFPFSYTMNPIFHMLAYQYGNTRWRFVSLNTIVAGLFAFIAHPLYVWADVLWLGNWNYINSFIYLMAIPWGVRSFVIWIANIEQQYATENRRSTLFRALSPAMKLLDGDKDEK